MKSPLVEDPVKPSGAISQVRILLVFIYDGKPVSLGAVHHETYKNPVHVHGYCECWGAVYREMYVPQYH